jgi:hypothetical protein
MHPRDSFESLLSDAMCARPLPRRNPDTAVRAMAIARARVAGSNAATMDAHRLEMLARQRRGGMLINALAAAVVVAMLIAGLLRNVSQSGTTDAQSVSSAAQVDSSGAVSSANDSLFGLATEDFVIVCGAVFMGTVFALILQRLLIADEAGRSMLVGWTVAR